MLSEVSKAGEGSTSQKYVTHAGVISIPELRKGPAMFTHYNPINLLETIGNLFERILQARILI